MKLVIKKEINKDMLSLGDNICLDFGANSDLPKGEWKVCGVFGQGFERIDLPGFSEREIAYSISNYFEYARTVLYSMRVDGFNQRYSDLFEANAYYMIRKESTNVEDTYMFIIEERSIVDANDRYYSN